MGVAQDLWDSFTGVAALRRRQDSGITSVPEACYDVCNDAALLAQSEGKTPAICKPDSAFQQALGTCQKCIESNSDQCNDTSNGDGVTIEFAQFLNYCADQEADGPAASIRSLVSSKSALAASASCIDARLASLQGNSSIASTSATTTSPPNQITVYKSTPHTNPPSDSPRVSVIVPAVVVPVVVVIVAIVVGAVFLRRRRQLKRAQMGNEAATVDNEYKGKPELPADSIRPELEGDGAAELYTVKPTQTEAAELPAREVVGSEMDAGGRSPR